MTDDPLSMLRKKPVEPKPRATARPPVIPIPQPAPGDTRQEYVAFTTKDRVEGIAIRRRKGAMSFAIMYNYLHSVGFDDDDATCLIIVASGYHIEIRGRNLQGILDAIVMRTCRSIQEFRSDRFVMPEPIDHSATFVESISIEIVHGSGEREAV